MKNKPHITFGLKDSDIVYVDHVPNGIECGCICSKCREPLVAKNQGKVKEHHFAHASGVDCAGGYETMLHQMAKKILSESDHIILPEPETEIEIFSVRFQQKFLFRQNYCCKKKFMFSDVNIEEKIDNVIPDIVVTSEDGSKLLIEIFVTHGIDETKLNKLEMMKLPVIEIDLSDFEPTGDSLERLKKLLIEETDKKKWIFPYRQNGQSLNRFVQWLRIDSLMEWYEYCPLKEEIGKRKDTGSIPCDSCEYKLKPIDHNAQRGVKYCIGEYKTIGFSDLDDRLHKEIHQTLDGNTICPKCGSKLKKYDWGALSVCKCNCCNYVAHPRVIEDREAFSIMTVRHFPCPQCGKELEVKTKTNIWSVFCRQCHYEVFFDRTDMHS